MDFQEADRRYAELKERHEARDINNEEFGEQLKGLIVRDGEGRWWAKSRKTGAWHYSDDDGWKPGTPPDYEAQPPPRPATTRDGQSPPRQEAQLQEKPSSNFLGQDLPAKFSLIVFAGGLLLGLGSFALVASGFYFVSVPISGMVVLASVYCLTFLLAVCVERWYVALGRSVAFAIVFSVMSVLTILLMVGYIAPAVELALICAPASAIAGLIAFGVNKLRYSMMLNLAIGGGACLITAFTTLLLVPVFGRGFFF